MLTAYSERRQRELHEQGTVVALAVNDPKRLSEIAPSRDEPAEDPESGFERWSWKGGE